MSTDTTPAVPADPFRDQLCDLREEIVELGEIARADLAHAQKVVNAAEHTAWLADQLIAHRETHGPMGANCGPESITPRTLNAANVPDAELSRRALQLRQALQSPRLDGTEREVMQLLLQIYVYACAVGLHLPDPDEAEQAPAEVPTP